MTDRDDAGDYRRLLAAIGTTPEEQRERNRAIDAMLSQRATPEFKERERAIDDLLEAQERRKWLVELIRWSAIYAAAVSAGWLGFTTLMAFLRDWILSLK
jgi:hypothetical protein